MAGSVMWTTEKPTVAGWYWLKRDSKNPSVGMLVSVNRYNTEDDTFGNDEDGGFVASQYCEFAGPIEPQEDV